MLSISLPPESPGKPQYIMVNKKQRYHIYIYIYIPYYLNPVKIYILRKKFGK